MGEQVEFPTAAGPAAGYLAQPAAGAGPGVMVIQEWWGLVPQITRVCDRLAAEGFTALAPDLYRGEIARHTEMDKAAGLMAALPPDRAARDLEGAVDFLLAHEATTSPTAGVVGFCMGGMLTMLVAARQGARIGAAVPFYGAPLGGDTPDWSGLRAPVLGHFAEHDDFFPPDAVLALAEELRALEKSVSVHVYPGTGHAFCNEENALGTYDEAAARVAWERTIEFLTTHLG